MVKQTKSVRMKSDLARLRQIEQQMGKLERERQRLEVVLVKDAGGAGTALGTRHRRHVGNYLFDRFRRKKLMYFLVTSIGAVCLWVGAWGIVERYILNPWIAVVVGLVIIWLTRHYD